jgi:AcrR family transcriptional regulator
VTEVTATASRRRTTAETREHVLAVAHELFYWQGIRAVGVDTIAREAGVAPTTLYRLFANKDDLVAAYIDRAAESYRVWFLDAVKHGSTARDRILALFEVLGEQVQPSQCRGCPFLMALAESPDVAAPVHRSAVALKSWVRDEIAALTRQLVDAGAAEEAEALADQLTIVMEGVYASVQALGVDGPARQASALVATLLPG